MSNFFYNLLELSLEAAPWLLLGLVVGGIIKAWLPADFLERQLGGEGFLPVVKAAIFGAPLPLCSCGVIPVALGLRRAGASKQATVSFLVSTPETGVDSVSVSYALLGPVMAVVRPVAAIVSALLSGFLVGRSVQEEPQASLVQGESGCCSSKEAPATNTCCGSTPTPTSSCCEPVPQPEASSCCGTEPAESSCCGAEAPPASSAWNKTLAGIRYSFTQLFNDIVWWLAAGLVFAALVQTYLPPSFLAQWGSGLPAMIIMALIGVPMYVCATASTPIATGLILAGVSPGTALVFLMAGPATNIATLGVIGKELGKRALIAYLTGVIVTAMVAGLLLDAWIEKTGTNIQAQIHDGLSMVPELVAWASLLILVAAAVAPYVSRRTSTA